MNDNISVTWLRCCTRCGLRQTQWTKNQRGAWNSQGKGHFWGDIFVYIQTCRRQSSIYSTYLTLFTRGSSNVASGYLHVSSNLLKFTSIICEWFATWNLFFLISSYRFIDSSSNVIQIWLRNVKVSSIRTTFAAPSGSCFRRCSRIRISSWAWRWNLFSLRTCMTKTTNFLKKTQTARNTKLQEDAISIQQ